MTYTIGERLVAVFLSDGEYYAIDDLCPHIGALLGAGEVCDGVVTCPWHAWRFRVADGAWADDPRVKIDRHEVRVVGEDIQVASSLSPIKVFDCARLKSSTEPD